MGEVCSHNDDRNMSMEKNAMYNYGECPTCPVE